MLLNSKGTKVQKVKSPLVTSCPPGPLLSGHQNVHSLCIFCLYSVAQGYPGELAMMIEMICGSWLSGTQNVASMVEELDI